MMRASDVPGFVPADEDLALPYPEKGGAGATGGWSGTDTSHERALRHRAKRGANVRRVEGILANRRAMGITVGELCEATLWHHGTASGVLSNLHKKGRAVLLDERRMGQHVYVLPQHAQQRPHAATRAQNGARQAETYLEALTALHEAAQQAVAIYEQDTTTPMLHSAGRASFARKVLTITEPVLGGE